MVIYAHLCTLFSLTHRLKNAIRHSPCYLCRCSFVCSRSPEVRALGTFVYHDFSNSSVFLSITMDEHYRRDVIPRADGDCTFASVCIDLPYLPPGNGS